MMYLMDFTPRFIVGCIVGRYIWTDVRKLKKYLSLCRVKCFTRVIGQMNPWGLTNPNYKTRETVIQLQGMIERI